MKTNLDHLEEVVHGLNEFEGIPTVTIQTTIDNFNSLQVELWMEYRIKPIKEVGKSCCIKLHGIDINFAITH